MHDRNKAALLSFLSEQRTRVSTSTCSRGEPSKEYKVSRPLNLTVENIVLTENLTADLIHAHSGWKGFGCVRVLVRWAKCKRLTNRLPNISLITLSPPGTDRILRVDASPHTRGSNFWGSRSIFQILDMRKLTFLLKAI